MRLAELQALVHRALRGEVALDAAAHELGVPVDRLALYRDFVADHLATVLAKVYSYTRAILGEPAWDALARAFQRDVPATAKDLNACVAPLPEWLAADPSTPAFAPALAQLEREIHAAFAHSAELPASPRASTPPRVNPTLVAFETRYAVVSWRAAHPDPAAVTPATPPPEPLAAPVLALVFRRAATHRVAFHVATDDLLFALKVAAEAVPLATAAALAGASPEVARAAVDQALALGLLL